jgi:hypothetical protein
LKNDNYAIRARLGVIYHLGGLIFQGEEIQKNANPSFQNMRGEAVTKRVATYFFVNLRFSGQIREKAFNIFWPEKLRMGFASEVSDITKYPLTIGLLRAIGITMLTKDSLGSGSINI